MSCSRRASSCAAAAVPTCTDKSHRRYLTAPGARPSVAVDAGFGRALAAQRFDWQAPGGLIALGPRPSRRGSPNMIRPIHFFLGLALATATHAKDLVDYVNTLQGTDSKFELTRGNTYPTIALPWGMHTWSPQTGPNGDGWKYQYFKDTIRGFQQAHQCSSWTRDYAVFSLMPVAGPLQVGESERAAHFRHEGRNREAELLQGKARHRRHHRNRADRARGVPDV